MVRIEKHNALMTLAMSALLASCDHPEPTVTASQVRALQCDPIASAPDFAAVMGGARVLAAEPRYSHVRTMNNNAEERIVGAKILIRPPDGVSRELFTRILQCHDARSVLGQSDGSEVSYDPFWLPDAWVTIDVTSEGGNYAVLLETDQSENNIKLAARAAAFATSRGGRGTGSSR